MTPRYLALARPPRAWVSQTEVWAERPTMQVWVPDDAPVDTGLVTAEGVQLYRVTERAPVGFGR